MLLEGFFSKSYIVKTLQWGLPFFSFIGKMLPKSRLISKKPAFGYLDSGCFSTRVWKTVANDSPHFLPLHGRRSFTYAWWWYIRTLGMFLGSEEKYHHYCSFLDRDFPLEFPSVQFLKRIHFGTRFTFPFAQTK